MEARKQALAADVVVVNHHLFFADVMLRDEGLAELLPDARLEIIQGGEHDFPETHATEVAELLRRHLG